MKLIFYPDAQNEILERLNKSMATNDKPFSKNSPTAPEFVISDVRDFIKEKSNFASAFNKLVPGAHGESI